MKKGSGDSTVGELGGWEQQGQIIKGFVPALSSIGLCRYSGWSRTTDHPAMTNVGPPHQTLTR